MATTETVTAPAVDTAHLTGITYSAVTTMVFRSIGDNALKGLAFDGNGRQTLVEGLDSSLGLVNQHLQVLAGHHGSMQRVRDYLPGYMKPFAATGNRESSELVWVLQ